MTSPERVDPRQFKITEKLVKSMAASNVLRAKNTKLSLEPIEHHK